MYKQNNKGYSLLETLLAVTVTMILLTAAMRILIYASKAASRAIVRSELMENARIASVMLSANIQRANEIHINADENNTLISMKLTQPGRPAAYVFSYNPAEPSGYHRLIFSGEGGKNELASNLADIRIIDNGADSIIIEILTDNTVTVYSDSDLANKLSGITVEPVFIRFPVNICGK